MGVEVVVVRVTSSEGRAIATMPQQLIGWDEFSVKLKLPTAAKEAPDNGLNFSTGEGAVEAIDWVILIDQGDLLNQL
jgi:hypothetical protein